MPLKPNKTILNYGTNPLKQMLETFPSQTLFIDSTKKINLKTGGGTRTR